MQTPTLDQTAPLTCPLVMVADPLGYPAYTRSLSRLALFLILTGLFLRFEQFALSFPIWCDEAYVASSILHRDFVGLTKQLEYSQVAPILFLWAELAVTRVLGHSEFALRLLPFLMGCGSLLLMATLARQTLSRLAATIAVGLLAVASWPIDMSCFVKPYSADLFFTLALLVLALRWYRHPDRPHRLLPLALTAPIAVGSSFPVICVAGAIGIGLLPQIWRNRSAATLLWFGLFNVLSLVTFFLHYELVGKEQLDRTGQTVNQYLQDYWSDAFPPASALDWPVWILKFMTGRAFAYPSGGTDGGSSLTFLAFAIGAVVWWRSGRRGLLVLMLLPFGLNLLAAFLHKYPLEGGRLSQHLVPAICLLAGTGFAAAIERVSKNLSRRLFYARCWFGCFCLIALGTALYYAYRPYQFKEAMWTRSLVSQINQTVKPGDRLIVLDDPDASGAILQWYLGSQMPQRTQGSSIDWSEVPESSCVWIIDFRKGLHDTPRLEVIQACVNKSQGRRVQGNVQFFMEAPTEHEWCRWIRCDVYWCTRPGNEIPPPRFNQSP